MTKTYKISALGVSIATTIVGAVLFLKPEISLKLICYAVSIIVLAYSASKFVQYFATKNNEERSSTPALIAAVFTALLGLFLVLRPTTISQIIPIVLGIIIIVNGLLIFGLGIFYRLFLPKNGMLSIIFGLICIILGLLCTLYSFESQLILIQFIGISLLVSGITSLLNDIFVIKAMGEKAKVMDVEFTTTKTESNDSSSEPIIIENENNIIDVEEIETK